MPSKPKLTQQQVGRILAAIDYGVDWGMLARRFGVTKSTISQVKLGKGGYKRAEHHDAR